MKFDIEEHIVLFAHTVSEKKILVQIMKLQKIHFI